MKNKRLLWILVMMILVVGSVMVEGTIWDTIKGLTGRVGGISGGVGIHYILINSILIGLFLFIVTHLLPENFGGKFFKLKSNFGKIVFFIALIGISIVYAVRIGNMFIWNEEAVVRPAFRYLFTQDAEGHLGILRPTRILIFLGTSFLLGWLFISVVKIGQGKKNEIDIVIAVILAAEMTHQGLTKSMLVALGQIISIWLLYRQFKREGETGISTSAIVWSFGLVIWISAIAFPGQGFLAPVTWLVKVIGYFNYLLLLIIAGIIATVVTGFVKKREKEAKEKARWRTDALLYPYLGIKNWARTSRNIIARGIRRIREIWDDELVGEVPPEFYKLRVELAILQNYLLRLHVYRSKNIAVEIFEDETKALHKVLKDTRGGCRIKSDAYQYKVGAKSYKDPKTTAWRKVTNLFPWIDNAGHIVIKDAKNLAFCNCKHLLVSVMTQLKEYLEKNHSEIRTETLDVNDVTRTLWNNSVGAFIGNLLGRDLIYQEGTGEVNEWYETHWGLLANYGKALQRDSFKWQVLDQNNVSIGLPYSHHYRFAAAWSTPWLIPVNVIGVGDEYKIVVDTSRKRLRYKESIGIIAPRAFGGDDKLYEVDERGIFMDDVNDILAPKRIDPDAGIGTPRFLSGSLKLVDEKGNKASPDGGLYYRQVLGEEVVEHSSFADICSCINTDWTNFIDDFRFGRYHPFSRTIIDYLNCHSIRDFGYYHLSTGPSKKAAFENPAFDREALNDPGGFTFKGRSRYDLGSTDLEAGFQVKDPAITTIGMSMYLQSRISNIVKGAEIQERFLAGWAWDSMEKEKNWFTRRVKKQGG